MQAVVVQEQVVVLQEEVVENQTRPTVVSQPTPGGVYSMIVSLDMVTTIGTHLDISATLGALMNGYPNAGDVVDGGIRIVVDGNSTGLGSDQSIVSNPTDLYVNFALEARVPVLPGPHTVELQWYVAGGGTEAIIGFINSDHDGATLRVKEVA